MPQRFDVAIIGYGPVGAVLAGLLAQGGASVVLIERAHDLYPFPRAAHFDHEIMRVFQGLGIADRVLEHARPAGAYEFRNGKGELLMRPLSGGEQGPSGWALAYMFNQPGAEHALRARVAELPNASVRLGQAFRSMIQHDDHVEITVADAASETSVIEAGYLIGCDGASSLVREAIGVGLEDYQFDEPWLVVDAIPADPSRMPGLNLQICDPARPTTCVEMGPGMHRWEFMMLPGEDAETVLKPGFVEALLEPWNVDVAIQRKAVYRFHGLIAERWRDGRVLLAGDSAHQMPPFAGQGMCSGVRDAANLAWKLLAVLCEGGSPDLLDTYQPERERSVRDYIEVAIGMGRVVCTLDPIMAAGRDAAMIESLKAGNQPAPPPAGGPGLDGGAFVAGDALAGTIFPQFLAADGARLDDALDGRAWLIDREGGPGTSGIWHLSVADPAVAAFRDALDGWLTENGTEAVLVRADRYVYGTGTAAGLLASWHATIGCAQPAIA
jgi:3-(3-hydroxy-phenyl)propionate hydroxylase